MAKKKSELEPGTLTTYHPKIEKAKAQVEAFLNALSEKDSFSIECFTTSEGIQVSVTKH